MTEFTLTRDHIALDALLKLLAIASSGGVAKMMVQEGLVCVNGEPELRRGRKLRAGDLVSVQGEEIRILGA
ncbi:MAG: RNA-binding protein [Candidatus Dactylopiibacterium carminicum]|uniref:RNA-binding protein n=1 Tax=Candidatus Dactylopiibacterium carminicum TaxID=857335 RepID=A0A272EWB5_9RHOO|nr:RNA-binding S4 domain-containing protein [Candidatus Dactylopiibacterium carminicum]KAF7599562.1 RNA-binding protein [Candidatus Dactylopiibacterium carminicum]PAS94404.1 MAG: RNA-binding protein [Candidatus Dactylopiibacterium carminicum]PAS96433.1 MAG: RNA-binding protein [Candidatus Dactylopiibacterium carminicum]PAS99565.1 MAG: RNA-binding protein [Candidatus Dactylopiibacterium carminicum]